MSGKRTYGQYNAERMVGGRKLRYVAKAPVAYSSRFYNQPSVSASLAAVMRSKAKLEVKGVDGAFTASTVTNTTGNTNDIQVLNLIAPGSGSFNRIGRKVNLKSVRLTGTASVAFPAVTTANAGDLLRMVVVWDKQPTGVLPNFDVIFGTTDQAGTETAVSSLSNLRYDNMERFQVVRDKIIPFNSNGASTSITTIVAAFDEYIKLNHTCTYSGQSATCTIADISSGALYLIFRTVYTDLSVTVSTTAGQYRLRYIDA